MVFCGQCGYQLAPGDKVCPRCGTKTNADEIEFDPGTYNPTEVSHAILERAPTQSSLSPKRTNPDPWQQPAEPGGPLVLGPVTYNEQFADETTTAMSAQHYTAQPSYPGYQGYPGYPQQMNTGYPQQTGYGYNPTGYQAYQPGQADAIAQMLEASRKGKIASLLLILFGLLLLIGAIVVFLLNQQGLLFAG